MEELFLSVGVNSSTELIILMFSVFIAISLVFSGLYFIFQPFDATNWTRLAVLVIVSFIIFLVVFVLLALIRKLIRKKSILTQFKCFSLIGYGGIALCSIAPRICVFFFVGNEEYITRYITFISLVISFQIHYVLLRPNFKHFHVDYFLDGTFSWLWKLVVFHIVVLLVTMRIAVALFETTNEIGMIFSIQSSFSLICVSSVFEFCQVLRGGIKLRNNDNNKKNGDVQNQEKQAENYEIVKAAEIPESKFGMNCKICTMEYSERRIPRILKECGHTLCEECADELLEINNQILLCCPFCQEVTMVKGPANLLAINYALLEVVENMK